MMLLFLSHGLIKVSALGLYLIGAYAVNNASKKEEDDLEQVRPNEEDLPIKRTIINRWLKVKKIEPVKLGREQYVNKLLVDFELQKEICSNLRKMHPNNWFELFMSGTDDAELITMIKEHFETIDESTISEVRKVSKINKKRTSKYFNNIL